MILINKLITTSMGWSYNFQKRVDKALSEKNYPIKFYPEIEINLDKFIVTNNFSRLQLIKLYMEHSLEELPKYVKKYNPDKIIFLEPFQMPYIQLISHGLDLPYDTFVHMNKDCKKYYPDQPLYDYSDSLPSILTTSKYVMNTLPNKKKRAIGAPLEDFKIFENKKKNSIIWAGMRVNDEAKGFSKIENIIKNFPDFTFYVCTNEKLNYEYNNLVNLVNLNSQEYIDLCKRCEFILSTANVESFGFCVHDAICYGCKPIVPKLETYLEFIPEHFTYNSLEDIKNILEMQVNLNDLYSIVEPNHYLKFVDRLSEIS